MLSHGVKLHSTDWMSNVLSLKLIKKNAQLLKIQHGPNHFRHMTVELIQQFSILPSSFILILSKYWSDLTCSGRLQRRSWTITQLPLLNPTINTKNHVFGTFFWSKLPAKIRLFPNTCDNASRTLLGSQNGLKMGFYSILLSVGPKLGSENVFLAPLGLQWLKLVSRTQN